MDEKKNGKNGQSEEGPEGINKLAVQLFDGMFDAVTKTITEMDAEDFKAEIVQWIAELKSDHEKNKNSGKP